jgi:hypothetical protein
LTENDWLALAAFEKVMEACVQVNSSLRHGIGVVCLTLLFWWADALTTPTTSVPTPSPWTSRIATLALLFTGFLAIQMGRRRLERVRLGTVTERAVWAALAVALVFAVNVVLNLAQFYRGHTSFLLLAIPWQLFAAFHAARVFRLLRAAQAAVSPPTIRQPLVEALEFLDDWTRQ